MGEEPAVQPEVDVDGVPALVVVEEVLAVGVGVLKNLAVEECRGLEEAALWRAHPYRGTAEPGGVVAREAVDRVAFGHSWTSRGGDGPDEANEQGQGHRASREPMGPA